jgi:moderate conductance mechanosensitive channel
MSLRAVSTSVLAQADDATDLLTNRANRICSTGVVDGEPQVNAICREVFRLTENRWLAIAARDFVPAVLRAIIVVLLAAAVLALARRAIDRFVRKLNQRSIEKLEAMQRKGSVTDTAPISLARNRMRTETIGGVLRSATGFAVWTVAVLMILGAFGFNLGPLIAGAGIVGVALGFGAQSLVKDFLSGIFMIMEDQFGVGDIVDVGEAVGTVDAITLRTTKIRSINGTMWHVPNGEITRVGNMSQLWSRALLDVGVAYETHVPDACAIMKRVADEMAAEDEWSAFFFEPAEIWGVQDLADNEVTIRMVAKVTPAKQWPIERQLRARIKHAFDEAGISIPFPQRTVWIRQEGDRPVEPGAGGGRPPSEGDDTTASGGGPAGAGERRESDLGDPLEPASSGGSTSDDERAHAPTEWLGMQTGTGPRTV